MFSRIMLLKLHDASLRQQQAQQLASWLKARGLHDFALGLPADAAAEKSWDLSLVLRFADAQSLNEALGGDAFHKALEAQLAGNVQVLKAWSFRTLE